MSIPLTKRRVYAVSAAVFGLLLCILAMRAAGAEAAFEITGFDGRTTTANGEPATQAGSHPYELTTEISFREITNGEGSVGPDGNFKDLIAELPRGLVGNPTVVPRCKIADFQTGSGFEVGNCPNNTAVGTSLVRTTVIGDITVPVYNLQPGENGVPRFGLHVASAAIFLEFGVRSGSDYGIKVHIPNVSQGLPVVGTTLNIWGVPGDESHDGERGTCLEIFGPSGEKCPSGLSRPEPLLSLPTACGSPLTTVLHAVSWQEPQLWDDPAAWRTARFDNHTADGAPVTVGGCEKLAFEPRFAVSTTPGDADSPAGLDVEVQVPQNQDPNGLATAQLREAKVVLPQGMTINPAAATGLEACSAAQIGIGQEGSPSCPVASRIGTAEIDTPLLEAPLTGSVYLARQGDNEFGSLLAIYLVAEGGGVVIKLPGRIATGADGQVTATFENTPQLPFSAVKLSLFSGAGAALSAPRTCGSYAATGTFTPWSGTAPVELSSSLVVARGPGGQGCPNGGFEPDVRAGTTNPVAAEYSPFQFEVSRADGTDRFAALKTTLPAGLLAKLKGVPYCSEAALAGVPTGEGTGAAQLRDPSCPAASRIGSAQVDSGTGPDPFRVDTGSVFLAGPYKGAPLSLAVVVPALAGPFDLGNVVVRAAVAVDPVTTEITASSDPLPQMLAGIPLDLRAIRLDLDRPQFTINPTSCEPASIAASLISSGGATADRAVRFQATDCAALGFTPRLSLSLKGATRRSGNPSLRAVLTNPVGAANLRRVSVAMPRSEFLDQGNIRTVCTRVQFAAGKCPAGSIYGTAEAWSPLLEEPLRGPVYLRSSSNKLPDLVAALHGQVDVDLDGRIDSRHGGIRASFEGIPDAPVSRFILDLKGGHKGLLENSDDLCAAKRRATVASDAQNGKVRDLHPVMRPIACKAAKKKRG